MQISFSDGLFVSSEAGFNYQEVLTDMQTAKTIRIVTFNISKKHLPDSIISLLKNSDAEIKLVSNIPSRMEQYFENTAGETMRQKATENIKAYFNILDPKTYHGRLFPFFNMKSHAKIIGTENIVYIGSANFSDESSKNIEAGIIIKDKQFINSLYRDFVDPLCDQSIPYSDECLTPFRLLAISLREPFLRFKSGIIGLYRSVIYNDLSNEESIIVSRDLDDYLLLVDKLMSLQSFAEDLCDGEENEYNQEANVIVSAFQNISFDSVIDPLSEGGSVFDLISFDLGTETDHIFGTQFASFAFDEEVGYYQERAHDLASEKLSDLCERFESEYTTLLSELEKINSILNLSVSFSTKWANYKRNTEVDNTD
jgi:hypothetical protein